MPNELKTRKGTRRDREKAFRRGDFPPPPTLRPGSTRQTQYSGVPLPLPWRTLAGFRDNGTSSGSDGRS